MESFTALRVPLTGGTSTACWAVDAGQEPLCGDSILMTAQRGKRKRKDGAQRLGEGVHTIKR